MQRYYVEWYEFCSDAVSAGYYFPLLWLPVSYSSFSLHGINALHHAEKITYFIQKLEEYKRGQQYGSNFWVVSGCGWRVREWRFFFFLWKWLATTCRDYTQAFYQSLCNILFLLLFLFFYTSCEGGKGVRKVKHLHKERRYKE